MKITDVKATPLFVPLATAVGTPISLSYADQLAPVVFGGVRTDFSWALFLEHEAQLHVAGPQELFSCLQTICEDRP